MDLCTTSSVTERNTLHSPTSLSLQDLINSPEKAECLLELLSADEISAIEQTIGKVKRRRLNNGQCKKEKKNDNHVNHVGTTTIASLTPITPPPTSTPEEMPDNTSTTPHTTSSSSSVVSTTTDTSCTSSTTVFKPMNSSPSNNNSTTTITPPPPPPPSSSAVAGAAAAHQQVLKQTTNNAANHPATAPNNEPVTEIRDGVEWVSFVYSHNRALKRYSIRTDIQTVDISILDDKFRSENCVYPRANLPKEEYNGNRWAYETECNLLGWKLAYLNKEEIAGKRGLIQRAVDSYRNRYPSMRSRRVARQEKLLNGTLRKRKHREGESHPGGEQGESSSNTIHTTAHHPKTIAIEDTNNQRFRIKINVESVNLDEINIEFRKANCPYPRAMSIPKPAVNDARWIEETMCNELAWKLAWLNPRHLAGKKNMLQRALDIYRSKFMPSLQPRKHSSRTAPIPPPSLTDTIDPRATLFDLLSPINVMPMEEDTLLINNNNANSTENAAIAAITSTKNPIPLTADALSAQNALYEKLTNHTAASPAMSNLSGTTASLDFADCFSLADEDSNNAFDASFFCNILLQNPTVLLDPATTNIAATTTSTDENHTNSTSSYSSNSSSATCTPSPILPAGAFTNEFFDQFIMPVDDPIFNLGSGDCTNEDTPTATSNTAPTTTAADLSKLMYNSVLSMGNNTTTPSTATLEDNFATSGSLLDPLF